MSARTALCALALACLGATQPAKSDDPDPSQGTWAERCEAWDDWDKPGPAFRIYGNSWYVGTCGISAILIAGSDGHVLIDGGTAKGADLIAANIAAAGFDIRDVKVILFSHEHDDHVGGLAKLQELSGAVVLSSKGARTTMETGGPSTDDPQRAIANRFDPVRVAGIAEDNMAVQVGDLSIIGWETPGHTPGAMSWQWQARSAHGNPAMTINYIDSLSPISADEYRFSDHPAYVAQFRAGLERMKSIGCGILVTPHPSASAMEVRIAQGGLVEDRSACFEYVDAAGKRLDARLSKEADSGEAGE